MLEPPDTTHSPDTGRRSRAFNRCRHSVIMIGVRVIWVYSTDARGGRSEGSRAADRELDRELVVKALSLMFRPDAPLLSNLALGASERRFRTVGLPAQTQRRFVSPRHRKRTHPPEGDHRKRHDPHRPRVLGARVLAPRAVVTMGCTCGGFANPCFFRNASGKPRSSRHCWRCWGGQRVFSFASLCGLSFLSRALQRALARHTARRSRARVRARAS